MVSWYTLLFFLWANIIRGDSSLVFNETENYDESFVEAKEEQPSYPKPSLGAANTSDMLCDGGGYAIYEDGVYIDGTASCNEPGTYCCIRDEVENEEQAQQSSITFNEENSTIWTQNCTNCTQNPHNLDGYLKHACDGFTGLICHGTFDSPNCKGEEACRNSTIGLIKNGSCQGREACKDTNITSVSSKSCIGEKSCSEADIGIVAASSCRGSAACHRSKIGNVTENSCVADREACTGATIDFVSQGSCQKFKSCAAAFLGTIVSTSCRGHYACGAQSYDNTLTKLGYVHQSCIGPHACHRSTIREVTLGSCVGTFPCGNYYGTSSIIDSVKNRSCVGNFAW